MKRFYTVIGIAVVIAFGAQCNKGGSPGNNPPPPPPPPSIPPALQADAWITKGDQSVLLQKQNDIIKTATANSYPVITVNDNNKYQTIDGFGYTLTGGSAQLLNALNEDGKTAIINELFGNGANSIGVSYLRLSMGASDLDGSVFSYNDLPAGQTDINQDQFSIDKDRLNLIPVLKKILAVNPNIKIIATPWSPPTWMKDNGDSKGGTLKPAYYDSYAKYFVKYIQAMKAEGIVITAITPQNEPYHPGNNPSLYMTAIPQRDFVKNSLGPAFAAAGITTKIILYDHNLDKPLYADSVLNDPDAAKYADGTAFHLYAGDVSAMTTLHNLHPDKNIYFTEQWTGANGTFTGDLLWHVKNVIIGTVRNWSRTALEWNLAADPNYNPHTPGGCTECKGALTINGNNITRNVSYYIIAHASKFVPPGSVRIESTDVSGVSNVAFLAPDGKKILVVANDGGAANSVNVKYRDKQSILVVPANAVVTIVW